MVQYVTSYLFKFIITKEPIPPADSLVVTAYLKHQFLATKLHPATNPLVFWKQHSAEYPILYRRVSFSQCSGNFSGDRARFFQHRVEFSPLCALVSSHTLQTS